LPAGLIEVETALGPVWFHGTDSGRPLLLLITGAFAEPWAFDTLVVAGVDVLRIHLPGNHCPPLAAVSVGAHAAAISQAFRRRFADRPCAVVGFSTGAIVAMGVDVDASGLVLVEPFLRTEGLWPLRELWKRHEGPDAVAFLWNVLGIAPDRVEPRDYTPALARLKTPAIALLAETPLDPPRSLPFLPSLVGEADRALLRAHPCIEVRDVPGGHNVGLHAQGDLCRAIDDACARVRGRG
jgi:hypothetical protein